MWLHYLVEKFMETEIHMNFLRTIEVQCRSEVFCKADSLVCKKNSELKIQIQKTSFVQMNIWIFPLLLV